MKNTSLLILLISALALTQCGEKKQAEEQSPPAPAATDTEQVSAAPHFEVAAAFRQQLAAFFKTYVSLKEALVAADQIQVKNHTEAARKTLKSVDMNLLSGPAHHDWMTYTAGLESSLTHIQSAEEIEAQRMAFSTLSDNLYKSIKAYGLDGSTAYYDFCPMAFNNKGGYWLSDQQLIRNPYFGDQMLTCGSIRETLK
jgi:Cu(I)/Ag(I) efflux system membrane fusion protein